MRAGFVATAMLTMCMTVAAAQPSPAEKIAPFVDDQTLVVGYADLQQADPQVIKAWLLQSMEQSDTESISAVEHVAGLVQQWRDQMLAAGANEVYVMINMANPTFVAPLTDKADADAISSLLLSGQPDGPAEQFGRRAQLIHDAVVAGDENEVKRLEQLQAKENPDLAKALAGDAPLRVALVGSDLIRQTLEQKQPQLPAELGGGPTTTLTRGIQWGSLVVTLPPTASARLLVQAQSADAAAKVQEAITAWLQVVARRGLPFKPEALQPTVAGNQLILDRNDEQLQEIARIFPPAVARGRENSKRVRSASNIRQMLQGCMLFANENRGAWPDDGEPLKEWMSDQVFSNPRDPEKGSYMYIKPEKPVGQVPIDVAVIYEKFDPMPDQINVGFADGHVELMPLEQVMQAVEKAKDAGGAEEKKL